MLCILKICPMILRDHLAVQASSIDSSEKQRLRIDKFLQANVHGAGATTMDVDAVAKTKGGKKGGTEKDKEPEAKKFDGDCFWCVAHCHAVKDCRKKAVGKPKTAQSPRTPEPKAKGKGKGGPGKRELLTRRMMDKRNNRLVKHQEKEAASLFMADVKGATGEKVFTDAKSTTDVTGKLGNGSRNRLSNSGNPTELEIWDSEIRERIDLTIDSGCAACAWPVGVPSTVGMQELNRDPREYVAANAEKIRELGFKTPTLKCQNGDVQNLKFGVMDKLHKPLVAACKVVAAGNRIVQPENQGVSFSEDVRPKGRKRIYERNGVYVLQKAFGTSG